MFGETVRAMCAAVAMVAMTHAASCRHSSAITEEHAFYIRHEAYHRIAKVSDLPSAVQSCLTAAPGVASETLAGPDDRIRSPMTFGRPSLPAARLVEAWCSPHHCLVQYEVAAFFGRYRLDLIGQDANQAKIEWAETVFRPKRGLDELRDTVLADAGGS
jgi:hypothetical protein